MFYFKVVGIFCMLKWQELVHYIKTSLLRHIAILLVMIVIALVIGGSLGGLLIGLHYGIAYLLDMSPDSRAAQNISGATEVGLFILVLIARPTWLFLKANAVKAVTMARETA